MSDLLERYRTLEKEDFLVVNYEAYGFIPRDEIPGDRLVGRLDYDEADEQFIIIQRGRGVVSLGRGGKVPLEPDPDKTIKRLSENEAEQIINDLERGLKK